MFISWFQQTKEKKSLEERLADAEATLTEEEEKGKGLMKLKSRYESTIGELEEKLHKESKVWTEKHWYLLTCIFEILYTIFLLFCNFFSAYSQFTSLAVNVHCTMMAVYFSICFQGNDSIKVLWKNFRMICQHSVINE